MIDLKKTFENLKNNTVNISELGRISPTMIVDGKESYAPVHVAPGMVLGPYTRDEMYQAFSQRGIPKVYFNQLLRLSRVDSDNRINESEGRVNLVDAKYFNPDGSVNITKTNEMRESQKYGYFNQNLNN